MDAVLQDLRYALRGFRRSPGFTALAVATFALGIGATVAIFSVLNAVLLRPLPYPEPDRLVQIWERTPDGADFPASLPNFRDFHAETRLLGGLAAADERYMSLTGSGEPQRLPAQAVSADYFRVLGASAALGRVPTVEETRAGAREVVLGHRVWVDRFGADRAMVGRTVRLNGEAYTVVGVMGPDFHPPGEPEAWVPLHDDPSWGRDDHSLQMIGRLAPNSTRAAVAQELASVAERLGRLHPDSNGGWGVRVAPLMEAVVGPAARRTILTLCGGVGLLLLLACANVASLLLGRATARRAEVGLRVALGAERPRIVRQLVTESLVLAAIGAVVGVVVAVWGVPLLKGLLPGGTPRLANVRVDGAALAFSVAISATVGVLAGLVPAFRASRPNIASMLGTAGRSTPEGGGMRDGLVVLETALATLLLIGAALLATSFVRLLSAQRGIDVAGVVVVPITLPEPRYDETRRARFLERATEAIGALPGVEAAGATNVTPLAGGGTVVGLSVEGRPTGPGLSRFARWRSITPGFFDAAGVALVSGRTLRASDYAEGAADVIVVTRRFARSFFPDTDPLGHRVAMGTSDFHWRTIIGVVEDVQDVDATQEPEPLFYMPEAGDWPWMTLMVKTDRSAGAIAPEIRRRIWSIDADIPVPTVESMGDRLSQAVAGPRFELIVMAVFGAMAVLLSAIGIYGVMAHFVAQRRREMGVRIALGGRPRDVAALILRRGGAMAGAGIAIGLVGGLVGARLLRAALYETAPTDPLTYLAVALLLSLIAIAAVAVPARQGSRVDPMQNAARGVRETCGARADATRCPSRPRPPTPS